MSRIQPLIAGVLLSALAPAACGPSASEPKPASTPMVTPSVDAQSSEPVAEEEPGAAPAVPVNDPALFASLRSSICGGIKEPCPPSWVEPKAVTQEGNELSVYLPVASDAAGMESADWMCRNARVWARDELANRTAVVITAVVVYASDGTVIDQGTIEGGC